MLKHKVILAITIIYSLFLLGFINNSEAGSITSFSVYVSDDWGSGTVPSASLTADEDIAFIDWHVDDVYKFTSIHGDDIRSVNVYLGTLYGNIKGMKYRIRAVVSFVDSSDEDASDTVRVYKPAFKSKIGPDTGVYGYAEVSSLSFNGITVTMSGYANANNGTDEDFEVTAWFRQQKYKPLGNKAGEWEETRRDPPLNQPLVFVDLPSGTTFSDSVESILTEFWVGRLIDPGEKLFYDAHTHLQVRGQIRGQHEEDDWEADSEVQEFTDKDNPD